MSELYENAALLLSRMENLLSAYGDKCADIYEEAVGKGPMAYISRIVTGVDPYAANGAHKDYFDEMQRASAALAEGLKPLAEEDRDGAGELAAKAVELLLAPAAEDTPYMEFVCMADDQHAEQFVTYLSDDKLVHFYEWMMSDKKRLQMVPTQEKVAESMKKEMLSRGVTVPSHGIMEKLKGFFRKK